jgi:hypothetical protein
MIRDFAGHCGSPPALADCSLMEKDSVKKGMPVTNDRERQEKKRVTDKLDRVAQPARQLIVHDVDADVFVVAQCP